MGTTDAAPEIVMVVIAFGLNIAWSIYTVFISKVGNYHYNYSSRKVWLNYFLNDRGQAITAIQTLRNSILTVTFYTSVMATVGTFLVGAIISDSAIDLINSQSARDPLTWVNADGVPHISPGGKAGAGYIVTLISLFLFIQQLRVAVNSTYIVLALSKEKIEVEATGRVSGRVLELVAKYLAYGQKNFSIGVRVFYLFFLVVMWLLGPISILVTGVFMFLAQIYIDFDHEIKQHVRLDADSS